MTDKPYIHWDRRTGGKDPVTGNGIVHKSKGLGKTSCGQTIPPHAMRSAKPPAGHVECYGCWLKSAHQVWNSVRANAKHVSQEQIDVALQKFKARGGIIQKLPPTPAVLIWDDHYMGKDFPEESTL